MDRPRSPTPLFDALPKHEQDRMLAEFREAMLGAFKDEIESGELTVEDALEIVSEAIDDDLAEQRRRLGEGGP